jgi:hypothetical protein
MGEWDWFSVFHLPYYIFHLSLPGPIFSYDK